MTDVNATTEHLDAVILVVVNLDEVDFGRRTHALEGDAVQFVVGGDFETGILHLGEEQVARVVGRLIATEQARAALTGLGAVGGTASNSRVTVVDRSVTIDDQTTPFAAVGIAHRTFDVGAGGHDDRLGQRTVGADLAVTSDDQVVCTGVTEDGDARLDGQDRAVASIFTDEDRTGELVDGTVVQGDVSGVGAGEAADALEVQNFTGFSGTRRASRGACAGEVTEGPARGPVIGVRVARAEGTDIGHGGEPRIDHVDVDRRDRLFNRAREDAVERVGDLGIVGTAQEPGRNVDRVATAFREVVGAVESHGLDVQDLVASSAGCAFTSQASKGRVLVDVEAFVGEVGDDTVVKLASGTFADQHALVRFSASFITDEGEVGDHRVGARQLVVGTTGTTAVVELEALVGVRAFLDDEDELGAAGPAIGVVHGVVADTGQNNVLHVDGATEHLDAIVLVVVDLDIVDRGAVTNALEGDAVQLVLGRNFETGITQLHILVDTGVVGRNVAAEQARATFASLRTIGGATGYGRVTIVDRRATIDDQATPFAARRGGNGALNVRLRGHDDRVVLGTQDAQLGAAGHNQVVSAVGADDLSAFRNGDNGRDTAGAGIANVFTDEDRAGNDITAALSERGVSGDVTGHLTSGQRATVSQGKSARREITAAIGREIDILAGATAATAARRRTQVFISRGGNGRIRTGREKGAGGRDKQKLAEVLLHRH